MHPLCAPLDRGRDLADVRIWQLLAQKLISRAWVCLGMVVPGADLQSLLQSGPFWGPCATDKHARHVLEDVRWAKGVHACALDMPHMPGCIGGIRCPGCRCYLHMLHHLVIVFLLVNHPSQGRTLVSFVHSLQPDHLSLSRTAAGPASLARPNT